MYEIFDYPPMDVMCGFTTHIQNIAAIAASTEFPPFWRISKPACEQCLSDVETLPLAANYIIKILKKC